MSIEARVDSKCDYCRARLTDGDDVACRTCYEKLEEENAELRKRIEELEAER